MSTIPRYDSISDGKSIGILKAWSIYIPMSVKVLDPSQLSVDTACCCCTGSWVVGFAVVVGTGDPVVGFAAGVGGFGLAVSGFAWF
jgi:hypothetical protein